jgi:hypothetical protein
VRKQMTDRISPGTMLLEDSTPTPEGMVIATEHYSAGWSSIIKSTSAELGRELERAGWTFFYMAGEIRRSSFGFNDQSRTDRAVAHLIDAVKRQHCNCLEITQIRRRSLLGLPYTNLVAHARHIQRSRRFQDPSDLLAGTHPHSSECLSNQTAALQGKALATGEATQAWENEGGSRAESICPA